MSLQYNVSQLLKAEVGQIRTYEFESDEPLDLDGSVADHIRGAVKFTLTNFGIIATAHADAVIHLTCARCLEPFQTAASVSIEEEFQPEIDIASGMPSTAPRGSDAFAISPNHTIDLSEALRQHLLLAIELVPVCSADCRGLCPSCGVNRNLEQCACPPEEVASPFAILQGLFTPADRDR